MVVWLEQSLQVSSFFQIVASLLMRFHNPDKRIVGTLSLEARNMDLIVVLDAPADSTTNTPLGVSMVISQEQVELASNGNFIYFTFELRLITTI